MSANIDTETDGTVAVMHLAREPVNALNPPFLSEFSDALSRLARDDRVRAVIVTARGRSLSAGMDLKQAVKFDLPGQTAMVDALNATAAVAYEFPKPMICAANGHAIAGGFFFVLYADYRIVSDTAMLGLSEVRVGVDFPVVCNAIATHELGPNASRRIMLSGGLFTADEMLRFGVIDAVTSSADVLHSALQVARDFAKLPPIAYAAVKRQVRASTVTQYRDQLAAGDPARDGWFTGETRDAARAVLEAAKS